MRFYTEERWQEWSHLEAVNYQSRAGRKVYKQKGYLHFDHRFWFPKRSPEIQKIVSSSAEFSKWFFYPFLLRTTKTHRFRYDAEAGKPRRSTKERPICFAAHKDALLYGFSSFCLTKEYEAYIRKHGFADAVLAYRTDLNGNCNIQFAKEVFDYIRNQGECTAIALDISSFFDTLNHETLKSKWLKVIDEQRLPEEDYKLFRTLTRFAHLEFDDLLAHLNIDLKKNKPRSLLEFVPERSHSYFFKTLRMAGAMRINENAGIPQGSPMSAVLSSIYMIDFDQYMYQLSRQMGFLYKRYCDDILLVCPDELADEVKTKAKEQITLHRLKVQDKKEEEIWFRYDSNGKLRALNGKRLRSNPGRLRPDREHYFYRPLQYLGFEFNGQAALIRNSSLCRFYKKMKRRLTKSTKMAYSRNAVGEKVFTQTTLRRYTHLGRRNFLTYVYKCAAPTYTNMEGREKEGMDSPKMRKQVSRHVRKLVFTLYHKNIKRFNKKSARRRSLTLKRVKLPAI